jgi:hypothetical protein
MSLYGEYLKECYNINILEDERYFVTYYKDHGILCCPDIYIRPEYRSPYLLLKIGLKLREIGRKLGCDRIQGYVSSDHKDTSGSMLHLKRWGFKFKGIAHRPSLTYFEKDI